MNPGPGAAVALAVLFDLCSGPLACVLSVGSQAVRALCSLLRLLWRVGVTPFIPSPRNPLQEHKARDAQTAFQQCLTSASHGALFLCQLGKPAAPGLAQVSSSLLQTPLCSARLVWLQRGDKDRQCLCHQSGTVACICVLFGLQTLPDLSVQQCPAPASLGVARGQAGTCRLSGTSLPHGTWPQRGPWNLSPPRDPSPWRA